MKKIVFLSVMMVLLSLAAYCFAAADDSVYTNGGFSLTVPAEYDGLLVVDAQEGSDILFSVSENASIEAAQAAGWSWDGAGWLFSIGCVDEERYHEMLCGDMSGAIVFAKDGNGLYFMFYHPTDVRMIRADNSEMEKDMQDWAALNQWAYSMRETFAQENGLLPETHGNTMLDIYLARMMYRDNENFTVSTTQYGPMEHGRLRASDYIEPLVNDAVYTVLNDEEAPDGEYVVLNFPDDDVRFDFFFMEGKQNIIRQVWFNGENEMLYSAEFKDPSLQAADIMNTMYLDMVLENSLGYTDSDFAGQWWDKIAGRCSIEISGTDAEGVYSVNVHWGSSAWQTSFWTMTAAAENGSELRYEDCKRTDVTCDDNGNCTETVVYENGTGSFGLLSTYELTWNDEVENAAENMLFVK